MPSTGFSHVDTGRLPSYRTTNLRYHPYPMVSRLRCANYLMATVDYRTGPGGLETIPEEPEAVRLQPVILLEERPDADVSSLELDCPDVDGELVRAAAESTGKLVNLLLALRRKVLALLAVVEYLKRNETK
ncbi:hypothetical protein K466DRAFT_551374 [Polyporus arcularius HHB13444]|uniref:Uncharacterized protein n=1 Tax=Polyporus arcularius HHB13444 TaxID=1314778 RepID=A0A5C3P881_9APHY|nr:hypothetical protein K466DRAFT_551374 [Polyporus arcularius HHB13444]